MLHAASSSTSSTAASRGERPVPPEVAAGRIQAAQADADVDQHGAGAGGRGAAAAVLLGSRTNASVSRVLPSPPGRSPPSYSGLSRSPYGGRPAGPGGRASAGYCRAPDTRVVTRVAEWHRADAPRPPPRLAPRDFVVHLSSERAPLLALWVAPLRATRSGDVDRWMLLAILYPSTGTVLL